MASNGDGLASIQEDVESAASIQEEVDTITAIEREIERLSDLAEEQADDEYVYVETLDSRMAAALLLERSLSQTRDFRSSRKRRQRGSLGEPEYVPSPLSQRAWNQAEVKTPPRSDDDEGGSGSGSGSGSEDDIAVESDEDYLETAMDGLAISHQVPSALYCNNNNSVPRSRRFAIGLGIVRPPPPGLESGLESGLSAPPGFGFPASMSPPPRTDLAPGIGPPPHYGLLLPVDGSADIWLEEALRVRGEDGEEEEEEEGQQEDADMPRSLLQLTLESEPDDNENEDEDDDDGNENDNDDPPCARPGSHNPIPPPIGSEMRDWRRRLSFRGLPQDELEDDGDSSGGGASI